MGQLEDFRSLISTHVSWSREESIVFFATCADFFQQFRRKFITNLLGGGTEVSANDIDSIEKDANKDKVSNSELFVRMRADTNVPVASVEAKASNTTGYPQTDKGNGTVRGRGSSKSDCSGETAV